MLHMRHEITRKTDEPTKAMQWGSLIHLRVLEPNLMTSWACLWDESRRTKEFKAFKAENEGKYIITTDEMYELDEIAESINKHPEARMILDDSAKEESLFWESSRYGKAKARFDCMAGDFIADLKSTTAIEPWAFQQQAYKLGYHLQAGWYCEGYKELFGNVPAFYVIAVESKPPYDVSVFEYDEEAIAIGREKAIEIAVKYRIAEKLHVYTGVMSEGIQTIRLPSWSDEMNEETDISNGEEMEASEL
jgi:hypothetical protein